MYDFTYHRPASIDDATRLITEDSSLLAGGQTLLPALKMRLANPDALIDLSDIAELQGIQRNGDSVTVGAMTRHVDVADSQDVAAVIPALAELAGHIGDPQVRNRGTLGGSIANNDPAADYPAALVALNATVHTTRRDITADDFFVDMFETALEEDEIVRAVTFPAPDAAAYQKFPNPASRYAIVGVMVARNGNSVRVAVTGAGPSVFRVPEMEQALAANFTAEAISQVQISPDDLNEDLHASAEYRAHLVGVMARRAVAAAR